MTLPATFDITLEFLSDWHIGTGHGRLGAIDAEVRRDADRLPFVPAKTLLGVWRDACETVADTFDRDDDGRHAWRDWATWLFGSQAGKPPPGRPPVPAALRLTPARAPTWLRTRVRGRPALAQAAVVLRPGVTVDNETGTATDRLLRVEERAIRSLRLHAQATVVTAGSTTPAGELPPSAELLLRAGARLIEGLGGKRNRGSGRVAVLLPDVHLHAEDVHPTVTDPHLVKLLSDGVPTPPPPPVTRDTTEIYSYDRPHTGQRRTVRVVFRVLTPVVAAHDVLGNVIFSSDAIPGTAMLGAMLARAEPAPDSGHRDRISIGDLCVGDAVPAHGDPDDPVSVTPAQPAPMVWRRSDKGRGQAVRNTLAAGRTTAPAADPGDPPTAEPEPADRSKPMSGWIVSAGDRWRHIAPAMSVSTHAIIDDQARRPTVASGGVYTYLGIAPGTLLCTDIVLSDRFRLRLPRGEQLRLGRSRKDDFGLVEVVEVTDPLPPAPPPQLGQETDRLAVWCVSDVLLRDDRLAPDPSPHALARALSAALAPTSFTVIDDQTVSATTRRDGFTVAWCRPRPSQVALRAGSVLALTVSGPLTPDRLAELERDGIGERTAEGYGRIRFNPPELTAAEPAVSFEPASKADPSDSGPSGERTDDTDEVGELGGPVHLLEVNAWRRAIRRASAELQPGDLVQGIDRLAGNRAQLGTLRAQLERLTLPNGPDMVRHWFDETRAVQARSETWTKTVLEELAALLLDDPDRVWERLNLAGPQPNLVLGPGRENAVRRRLHTEAVTTAVTDALRRINRQRRPGSRTATITALTGKEER